jgi:hypothetical protein
MAERKRNYIAISVGMIIQRGGQMCKIKIAVTACLIFMITGCATNSSFYGERLVPSDSYKVLVMVDDKNDNSVFRGNEFLQKEIINNVCQELKNNKINAFNGMEQDIASINSTHVILLVSQGVSVTQGYHQSATMTRDTYRTLVDSHGNTYTYNIPVTTGGGGNSYTVKEVQAVAILFEKLGDGKFRKLGMAYSHGSGMNPLEKRFNMTTTAQVFGYEKDLSTVYSKNFTAAVMELFDLERK